MASTQLSKETLEKHNQKAPVAETAVEDVKKSDKKSEAGSASGQQPASGKTPTMAKPRRVSRWRAPPQKGLHPVSALSLSSKDRMSLQRMENTYKMKPDDGTKFAVAKVRAVTDEAIKKFLGGTSQYDPEKCTSISKALTDDILNRVKELGFARYKMVVHVVVGQVADQSMEVASRCVWDVQNDNVTTVSRRQGDVYVIANVFGTYFE